MYKWNFLPIRKWLLSLNCLSPSISIPRTSHTLLPLYIFQLNIPSLVSPKSEGSSSLPSDWQCPVPWLRGTFCRLPWVWGPEQRRAFITCHTGGPCFTVCINPEASSGTGSREAGPTLIYQEGSALGTPRLRCTELLPALPGQLCTASTPIPVLLNTPCSHPLLKQIKEPHGEGRGPRAPISLGLTLPRRGHSSSFLAVILTRVFNFILSHPLCNYHKLHSNTL